MILSRKAIRVAATTKRRFIASIFFSSQNAPPPSVTLYQYAICPFCNKAKALLAYAGIRHEVVEVNPLTKAELKPWSGDYRKVPIAKIDGDQVNGSDEICNSLLSHPFVARALESRWQAKVSDIKAESRKMSMNEFQSSESASRWSKFSHDELAALLYPNICRSLSDSYQAFGYVSQVDGFSPLQKMTIKGIGSLAMYFAASKIKRKRGISDEREALHSCLSEWEDKGLAFGKKGFASGMATPNMGDLSVFGTLRSIEGLPAHDEAVKRRGGAIVDWYDRMKLEVCNNNEEKPQG